MLDHIKEKVDQLEILYSNFINDSSKMKFLNQRMTELVRTGHNLPVQFDYLLVAISRNGGLIGICKKMNYLDQSKTNIQKNILVMHQDAGRRTYSGIIQKLILLVLNLMKVNNYMDFVVMVI